jgi:hypothetical protein
LEERIIINGKQKASIRLPKVTASFDILNDAILHWRRLSPVDREHALLVLDSDQRIFQPSEIELIDLL